MNQFTVMRVTIEDCINLHHTSSLLVNQWSLNWKQNITKQINKAKEPSII